MEKPSKRKSFWLESALGISEGKLKRIIVVEDDARLIKETLKKEISSHSHEFLINITGGTKMMTIAIYDYFKDLKSNFYYVPLGKNVIKELNETREVNLQYRLNLKEYFLLNGLRFESNNSFCKPAQYTCDLFESFRKVSFQREKCSLISSAHSASSAIDRKYFSGEWFEEYCYSRIKREKSLSDDCIAKSSKIYRDNVLNDNEIDLMFIENNTLHVCECKSSMNTTMLDYYLYKLSAIAKDYGFRPKSYLLTLKDIKSCYTPVQLSFLMKRCDVLGVQTILDCSAFKENILDLTYRMQNHTLLIPKDSSKNRNKQGNMVEIRIVTFNRAKVIEDDYYVSLSLKRCKESFFPVGSVVMGEVLQIDGKKRITMVRPLFVVKKS